MDRASTLGRVAAVLALALVAAAVLILLLGGGKEYRYTLMFETAGQLVDGNQVKIGGAAVGSVEKVDLTEDNQVEVGISMPEQLHEGSTAVIRSVGLAGVANHYVSVTPGPNDAPPLPDGAVVSQASTTTPVDIDQVFDAFDKPTRDGLADVIQGQAGIYAGKGEEANESYKYLEPALGQTNLVLDELNRDQRMFERFIVSGSRVFTAFADRGDDLAASLTNARTAFDAIARENRAFSRDLELLAPTFRQSNTTFVNLRAALDDLDRLVAVAKPATEDLAPFLRDLRPVVSKSVPFFTDLGRVVDRTGAANDLGELVVSLPKVEEKAGPGFRRARRAIGDFEPTLSFARPYAPEMLNALAKLGQVTSRYDANGHYVSLRPAGLNLFDYDQGSGQLDPIPPSAQYQPFEDLGAEPNLVRCPGGASQPRPDDSNPFVDPPWPSSGLDAGTDCDPDAVPPGP